MVLLEAILLIIILTFISYLFKDTSINVKALITIAVIVINLYCIKFKNLINIHAAN